jgi:hypothetical protein
MAQPRPMSTPIFDELLREFTLRLEEHEEPPAAAHPAPLPPAQGTQTPTHRHRAE